MMNMGYPGEDFCKENSIHKGPEITQVKDLSEK